ncbi:MAG: outer membrane beta-barrel protein [Ignavibacteriaceae bacterium]
MKKIFVTILLVAGIAFTSNAQTKNMAVGADFVVSIPIGSLSDGANVGFGGLGSFEYAFMPQLVGIGQVGYISYGTKSANLSFHTIPIVVGAKYFFTPGVGFYGISQLGLAIFSSSVEIPAITVYPGYTIGGGSASSSSAEFSFAVGAGYEMPVGPRVDLDFSALFNLITGDANNIQIRAGAKYAL